MNTINLWRATCIVGIGILFSANFILAEEVSDEFLAEVGNRDSA
jgi:hypothetical protein